MLYTDPSGHFGIIEGIIFGVVIGTVASGIQSDWDLEATIVGGVIGGVTGGVGAGIGSSVFHATVGALGQTWAGVAGGVVGGAAAGGTSGVLASAAGYKVNIGLAIASGAAAGGIAGGAGAWGAQHGYGELTAFAASPAAGASAAAIRGSDPGVGAVIAAATAAFSLSIQSIMNNHNLAGRGLTANEVNEASLIYGSKIDYDSVRIFNSKIFWTQNSGIPVSVGGNIYWPSDSCGDMVTCGDALSFIHEMAHVMQHQQGINVLGQGFLLQAGYYGSLKIYDPYSFVYSPTRSFSSYNIEQQGALAEKVYEGKVPNIIK